MTNNEDSVIQIKIKKPRSCSECPMCHPKGKVEAWNFCCFATMQDIHLDAWTTKRHPCCPIL